MAWLFIVIFIIVVLALILFGPSHLFKNVGSINFFAKGSDAGFSFKEIRLLWLAAKEARVPKPDQLFFSVDELDRCIDILHKSTGFTKNEKDSERLELLKKMYDYRKKIEFERPRYNVGLKSTYQIPEGQILKLRVGNLGIFKCKVLENKQDYLQVSYPAGPPTGNDFSWRRTPLNVYFWNTNDAGYFFQSVFIEGYKHPEGKDMRMRHGDMLLRSQKRKSVRVATDIAAQMYILNSIRFGDNEPEYKPGLQCRVLDISEDGAAIRIRGKGKKGLPVKLQFIMKGTTIAASGLVKSLQYHKDKDQSLLHLEFLPLPDIMRMAILSYVYDVDRSRKKYQESKNRELSQKHHDVIKDLFENDEDKTKKTEDSETKNKVEPAQDIEKKEQDAEDLPDLPESLNDIMDDHLSSV